MSTNFSNLKGTGGFDVYDKIDQINKKIFGIQFKLSKLLEIISFNPKSILLSSTNADKSVYIDNSSLIFNSTSDGSVSQTVNNLMIMPAGSMMEQYNVIIQDDISTFLVSLASTKISTIYVIITNISPEEKAINTPINCITNVPPVILQSNKKAVYCFYQLNEEMFCSLVLTTNST